MIFGHHLTGFWIFLFWSACCWKYRTCLRSYRTCPKIPDVSDIIPDVSDICRSSAVLFWEFARLGFDPCSVCSVVTRCVLREYPPFSRVVVVFRECFLGIDVGTVVEDFGRNLRLPFTPLWSPFPILQRTTHCTAMQVDIYCMCYLFICCPFPAGRRRLIVWICNLTK